MHLGLAVLATLWWAGPPSLDREPPAPPPGRLVDVGGHRLHLLCKGDGSPTVVLESGLAEAWVTWSKVHDPLAAVTRVCAYDRAGVGFSDPGPTPRTSRRIARELRELLSRAGVPGPYVLVGHSIGGYHIRLYAHEYPKEVAGLVLLDSSHEEQAMGRPKPLVEEEEATLADLRSRAERAESGILKEPLLTISGLDPATDRQLEAVASRPTWYRALYDELGAAHAAAAEVRAIPRAVSVPITVVSAGRAQQPPSRSPEVRAYVVTAHRSHQASLVRLSPLAKQIVVEESGHNVHWAKPEVVIAAVTEMVQALRGKRPKQSPRE